MSKAAEKEPASAEVIDINKLKHIKKALGELDELYRKKQAASDAFADGCTRIGEKAGIEHTVLKKFIAARVKDKVEDFHHKAEQMDLLYNEL